MSYVCHQDGSNSQYTRSQNELALHGQGHGEMQQTDQGPRGAEIQEVSHDPRYL